MDNPKVNENRNKCRISVLDLILVLQNAKSIFDMNINQ